MTNGRWLESTDWPKLAEIEFRRYRRNPIVNPKNENPAIEAGSILSGKKHYFFAYFFLNLSMRPAVSTNTFLPVKNG
jgi:hypothetical protein